MIAVGDLDEASDELERLVGLAATGGGLHPALGTQNRLAWLGDTYVELVSIADRTVAEASWLGAPAMAALQLGGGLATWAMATDAIDGDVAALRSNGARLGDPMAGARERPDGTFVRWRLAVGEVLGPAEPPFLIEHDPTSAEWTAQDRAARAVQDHPIGGPVRLEVLELPVSDVPAAVHVFGRAADLRFRPSLSGGSARDANLGRQVVRLRSARGGTGRPVVGLASPAGDGRSVDALGCRWTVRQSG